MMTKPTWMIPNQTRDYYEQNQRNNPIEDLNNTEKKSTKIKTGLSDRKESKQLRNKNYRTMNDGKMQTRSTQK